ncbi:uncharacterized protein LOC136043326, partial [Artemia franciscana]|uniref:uncharacterized protein LOC136043326 n=1 Tax=Artemia franciscana TaxID=6661 RepID=UPI0032DA589F
MNRVKENKLDFVVLGDFNTDLDEQSYRSREILECMPPYVILKKDLSYSYIHQSGSVPNIDPIISSSQLKCSIIHVDIESDDIDHLSLSFTTELKRNLCNVAPIGNSKWFKCSNWKRADIALYILSLSTLLNCIRVPYHLLQLQVKGSKRDLDRYYDDIIRCMKEAEKIAVPQERIRIKTRKSIWAADPELKNLKNKAKLWLRIWVDCGRPITGSVADIKQKTKNDYKKYLKSIRYNGMEFPASKKDWSKLINSEKLDKSDLYNSDSISSSTWYVYYSGIFSKINFFVQSHYSRLLSKILPPSLHQGHIIPVSITAVENEIKQLKSSSIDIDGISVNNINPKCVVLLFHLQLLFQMCLTSSLVPDSFLCGNVTSILKRGKLPSQCSSYRPITTTCNLSKILEYILIPHLNENINFGSNQFGFQAGIGCQHAHRVLSSALKNSMAEGSPLYMCTLDLSKAFDN